MSKKGSKTDFFTSEKLGKLIKGEKMLLKRGRQRFKEGKYEDALQTYKIVLRINPDNEEAKQKVEEIEGLK